MIQPFFYLSDIAKKSFGEKKMLDQCRGLIAQEISLTNGVEIKEVENDIDSCFA